MLELAVLGLLKEQPLHGYELKKRLGDTLGVFWGVSYGSLYPALRRLERSGAIEAVTAERASSPIPATGSIGGETAAARLRQRLSTGRRTKKSYRITAQGEKLFAELFLADDGPDDERAFAFKLAFCRDLAPDVRLAFLERRRAELAARLDRTRGSKTRSDRYIRSLVEHRTRSLERDLEWVDDLVAAEHDDPEAAKEGVTA